MQAAVGGDVLLERGIRNMGKAVWPHWLEVYEQRSKHPLDADQLSFFEQSSSSETGAA